MLQWLLPWDFSPTVLVVTLVTAVLYARGVHLADSPPLGRRVAFALSLLLMYAALQTRWDYYAGHMFFAHRLQHLVLHDVGPCLLAASAPWAMLARGLPARLRERLRPARGASQRVLHVLLEPWTATLLFVASLMVWVWPPLHFDVMLSNWLYRLMNWSVVLLDLPFWWLVLDPRVRPAARLGSGARLVMLMAVMMPMIFVGAIIGLSRHDLYPVYGICGRWLPWTAVADQQLGGMIIWIGGSLLVVIAALLVIARALGEARRQEALLYR